MIINDGAGSGRSVKVNEDNQLAVAGVVLTPLANATIKGNAYSWTAVSADIDAGDTGLLVCNNSLDKKLHITKVYAWADVATQFKIHCPAYATITGTAVVGNNLNRSSKNIAEASAFADETASAFVAGNTVATLRNNEVGTDQFGVEIDFEGALVLGYHDSVAVDLIAESGAFEATIFGYFE